MSFIFINANRNSPHRLRFHAGFAALYLQDMVPGAITTGLFRPAIWVNQNQASDPELAAILLHEHMHIRHHDNLFLWLITFAEKIFWWNPLVLTLASRTRQLQELSCDEACSDALPAYLVRMPHRVRRKIVKTRRKLRQQIVNPAIRKAA